MSLKNTINKINLSIFTSAVLLSGALGSTKLAAQQNDSIWTNIEYLKTSNPWLTSENATGLHNLKYSISEANIYGSLNKGKFINYYQSDNSLELGALTESYYRLNNTTSFYGQVSYSNFEGKNMGGSVFIDPEYTPLNIAEVLRNNDVADNTRGTKKRESYHLIGAINVDISNKVSLGGKIDYKTANYAKQKDMRHVNKVLDLNLTVGYLYQLNNKIAIGSNYYYGRNIESIKFSSEGNKDISYYALIDFGNFIGKLEELGKSGKYLSDDSAKPMTNIEHGITGQINITVAPNMSIFNEFGYKSGSGQYGDRGTSSPVLTEHNSDILEYRGALTVANKKILHIFNITTRYESLKNNENVFRTETLPSGASVVTYYGSSEILNRNVLDANINYTANIGSKPYNPTWMIESEARYKSRKQTSSLYPFYRKQTINNYSANLSATRNIMGRSMTDMYSVSLGFSYGSGSGNILQEGLYTTPSESQDAPNTSNEYLYREYEYLTATRMGGHVGFKYSRIIDKNIKAYLQMRYAYTKAMDIKYLEGSTANAINVTLGCSF